MKPLLDNKRFWIFISIFISAMLFITLVNPVGSFLNSILFLVAIFGTMGCGIWFISSSD